ncbi:YqgQ family protein [Kyrpidia spormannii]|uniref:DUF910 domain-containing protein n=1 Tax=Kyrpidia spormannii TaxID=2055160 RepID=A0A6F9E286_9BACL|nr:YqgQ family protein [Kyrpidia spormannii]CAB3390609.1 conserved protein of unknown function [Kyrpidia spormannii]
MPGINGTETPGSPPGWTLADVKSLLRRFGIIVYIGSPLDDLLMMELELEDLWGEHLIDRETYLLAKAAIAKRRREIERQS